MTSPILLNDRSSIPLYLQLKTALLRLIQSGKLKPHERIPSERELGEKHGISRMTARRAIQSLIWEGFLYTRAGKGTYVGEVRLEQKQTLTGFSEEIERRGLSPSSQVLEFAVVPASPEIADRLGIAPSAEIYHMTRLRLATDQVVAIESVNIPRDLCPNLNDFDFARQSLYAILNSEYGIKLVSADQTIEAALASRRELSLLQLRPPAAILRMKRITRTEKGLIVEYTESVYRSDRYKLTTTLETASE